MTVREAYQYVQNRLNARSTNMGDNIEAYQFVEAFNAAQMYWCEDRIKLDETNITRKDEIQNLLKVETIIPEEYTGYVIAKLPEDYYHYKRSVSQPCGIMNYLVKEADINRYLHDSFWEPSLEWQETICTLVGNTLKVYTKNFSIEEIELTYYRAPRKININDGFTDVNNDPTANINPEFGNSSIYEILDITCMILAGDASDQFGYKFSAEKIQKFN